MHLDNLDRKEQFEVSERSGAFLLSNCVCVCLNLCIMNVAHTDVYALTYIVSLCATGCRHVVWSLLLQRVLGRLRENRSSREQGLL